MTDNAMMLEQRTEPVFTVIERAIIYVRVSTDEQAENGTSIDNQVEKCLAYAQANGLQVVEIFKEDYTGVVLDRPELIKVREMLQTGQANNLIVYKPNRLDRSEWGINLLILMHELKQLDVSLHYAQDARKVDLNNPMEAFMYGSFAGWQAGEDHRETVTKLHEGRIKRVKDGYVVPNGNLLYGYRKVCIKKRWYFEIYEPEARLVRLIFQWYVIGDETGMTLTMHDIAERLNQMGFTTRCGGRWLHGIIRPILKNETYAGVWYYRKEAARRDASIEAIPVSVPLVISRELWEQAQKQIMLNTEFSRRNRKPGRYLLARRVTCGDCGYKMTGNNKKDKRGQDKYFYYVCPNMSNHKERACVCHSPRFHSKIVDAKVWDRLEEVSRDREQLVAGLRGYQARQESKTEPIRRELAYVENLIKEKTAEWEDDYASMKFLTSDRAKAKKAADIAQVEAVLDGLEKRKADLLTQLEDKSLTDEQIIGITEFAAQVADDMTKLRQLEFEGQNNLELKKAVYEAKRKLLAVLDLQVTLFVEDGKRKARITAKYCPEGEILTVDVGNTNIPL
jgi:site-specific DNA recombinase